MKLGTRLTLYLSLIIIVVLSGYGYLQIYTRRDILIRKMKVEVRSIGRALKISLEKISLLREMEYVQELIDALGEDEKILGVLVYHKGKNLLFHSRSLNEGVEPFVDMIKKSIEEDQLQEKFGSYKSNPVFLYIFPLKNKKKKNIGGVSIIQNTTFMEEDIKNAKWTIFITVLVLIGGTVFLVLFIVKKWISQPVSALMDGVNQMAKGHLNIRIDLQRGDEIFELAQTFNHMAEDLKEAQEKIIQEADTKLELERSLRQSEKLATIGQLASGLAHEIGTPLNIISGRAEWIKRKLEDKEGAQRNLDVIIQQTERITRIIQQLLGFVRKKKPEQKSLNIGNLLETTLDFIEHQIQRQKVKIVKDIKENLPLVMGDPDLLQQVFSNLILNALQAMPKGGTLRLFVSPRWIAREGLEESQQQYVEVGVEDTGMGMDKEIIQNIFNPFYTTKDTGTGLGLMVSQGIVKDHEGWIEVESEIGKGSLFKIYLPGMAPTLLEEKTERESKAQGEG